MGRKAGTIHELDESGYIDLRLGNNQPAPTATALIPGDPIRPHPKPVALERLAEYVIAHGIEGEGSYRVARDLLMHSPPRFIDHEGGQLVAPGVEAQRAARKLVLQLEDSYLARSRDHQAPVRPRSVRR